MAMSEAEKKQLIEVVHGMSEEQLAVVASEIPSNVLTDVISKRMDEMERVILLTADALQGRAVRGSEREISVIGV